MSPADRLRIGAENALNESKASRTAGLSDRSTMHDRSAVPPQEQLTQSAASWYARLAADDVSAAERAQFAAWRAAKPEHDAAYRRLIAALDAADVVLADTNASAGLFDAAEIGDETLESSHASRTYEQSYFARAGRLVRYGIAAGLLIGVASLLIRAPEFTRVITAVGERRSIRLPDGSTVDLNTATQMEFAIDERMRRVKFREGEAFFQIAADTARPFVISVGSREVRVVGTEFNIRHLRDRTDLAVTEGKVSLSREMGSLSSLFPPEISQTLSAGMLASYTTDTDVILRTSVPTSIVAPWRDGQLIYRGERLASVIADLDRYFEGIYVVTDEAAALRVSAVVNLSDEQSVLSALARQLPVDISRPSEHVTRISLAR